MKKNCIALALFGSGLLLHADTPRERLADATAILNEVMASPDRGIPHDLLDKAHCVIIVPGMKQAAFVVGGKYGRGFAVCRADHAGWGSPSAVRVEGGSFGFQIGASSTDVVMLVMNERGMRRLLEDKFTLGAEATVAAGPVGRSATAQTDAQFSADILSWSRSKGLFAGIALQGATLRNDTDENRELYGQPLKNKDILLTNRRVPADGQSLVAALDRYSPTEAPNKPLESRAVDTISGAADRNTTPGTPAEAHGYPHSNSVSSVSIREAQRQLKSAGYYNGRIDGVAGPMTRKAIRMYQQDNNLAATGRLDGATRDKLALENQGEASRSVEGSSSGMAGDHELPSISTVKSAQRELHKRGLYSGAIDGICGPNTQSAIRRFQENNGLTVNGQLDQNTVSKLTAVTGR
jgi:lipid-binding SYLF domain-containing protein/peptidoglycan hydrolase-like protein with peptidoglycan-binding domain